MRFGIWYFPSSCISYSCYIAINYHWGETQLLIFKGIYRYEYFVSVFADPPDFTVDDTSHQKSYQNRSRRGRNRNGNDRSLSGNSFPSRPYDHQNQDFNPPFRRGVSDFAVNEQQPLPRENDGARQGGRGRGRGWRDGNRNVSGSFGSSRQRPGGEFGRYSGNDQGKWASHAGPRRDGPSSAHWRRNEEKDLEQSSGEQDAEAKAPRKFNLERRRQHHYEKENNAREGSGDAEEDTQRVQSGKTGPYFQCGAKRRQGPIKPPKAPGTGSEGLSRQQPDPGQSGASLGGTLEAGQSSGRHTAQTRGRRRPNQQNPRGSQRRCDPMPESRETQTGETRPLTAPPHLDRRQTGKRPRGSVKPTGCSPPLAGCLIEQLSEEKYECMVCCDIIRPAAPVWSCQSCFHVFHLNCIKKWARSPASQADGGTASSCTSVSASLSANLQSVLLRLG